MVETGAPVKKEPRRLFPHDGAVRHRLRALDVEEQPHPVDKYVHHRISLRLHLPAIRAHPFAKPLIVSWPG